MKKIGLIVGAAALATLAGCRDPNYTRNTAAKSQNEATEIKEVQQPAEKTETNAEEIKAEEVKVEEVKQAEPKVQPKPVEVEPETTVYVVQRGDYLAKISKKYNVTIASIKRLNNLKNDNIRIGQKLKLPGKIEIQQAPADSVKTDSAKRLDGATKPTKEYKPYTGATKEYVVKSGDYLGKIAAANKLSIRQLCELNGIKSNAMLKIGQKLKVPAEVAASAVTTSAAAVSEKKDDAQPPVKADDAPTTGTQTIGVAGPDDADVTLPPVAGAFRDYTVKEGETLNDICGAEGLVPAEIREINRLGDEDEVVVGQVIKLPIPQE